MASTIHVLAGVNGAGKSSIGENIFLAEGSRVFNPDSIAQKILDLHPDISLAIANGHAWQLGKSLLEQAINDGCDYRFETTLGGNTIPDLLRKAVRSGHQLAIWFCGLESADLHIQRVKNRVAHGGHDIPVEKIQERWTRSRENLIRLLPVIHHLRVYDNSYEADPVQGHTPRPVLLLEMQRQKITAPDNLTGMPEWVQPIIAAAGRIHGMRGFSG